MVLPSINASLGSFVGREEVARSDGGISAGAIALLGLAGERVELLETLKAAGMGPVFGLVAAASRQSSPQLPNNECCRYRL
jgi:hypothetical protein